MYRGRREPHEASPTPAPKVDRSLLEVPMRGFTILSAKSELI